MSLHCKDSFANVFLQFSIAFAALISALPYLAQGFAVPDANPAIEVKRTAEAVSTTNVVPFKSFPLLSTRADDDEWLMVIYNNGNTDDQCGGTPNEFSGKSSLCQGLTGVVGKICADVKVSANVGFAKCEFSFRADGSNCGGTERQAVTVNKGDSSNRVKLSDDVKFVSINCS